MAIQLKTSSSSSLVILFILSTWDTRRRSWLLLSTFLGSFLFGRSLEHGPPCSLALRIHMLRSSSCPVSRATAPKPLVLHSAHSSCHFSKICRLTTVLATFSIVQHLFQTPFMLYLTSLVNLSAFSKTLATSVVPPDSKQRSVPVFTKCLNFSGPLHLHLHFYLPVCHHS